MTYKSTSHDRFQPMSKKKPITINRRLTDEERASHKHIIAELMQELPPKSGSGRKPSPPGIPTQVRQAREQQRLTWYALAQRVGIPREATIRDIEQGRDVMLSDLRAVAQVMGLQVQLVPID
jgi:DNA-binding XRE family transcriptional regulator